jgi:hypothetical protein
MAKASSAAASASASGRVSVDLDLAGPAAASALSIAHQMYERMIPLRPPTDASPERLAEALAVQAQQVGRLAWEILYGLNTPQRP